MNDSTRERLAEIASDIDRLSETLDEISFDVLREAQRNGEARPAVDKAITQARRALEKASRLLAGGPQPD
ncbi:MAG: hypothetical protein O3C62_00365 [Actinomycetota bacterium]|nr:hypothetical protein [Actinomycetota bacterium]MDA2970897.1 hypothetical protein [Actinomycetota bacterium]MDA3000117.1 hypothetical protein [Actinomycetota bacterium]